MLNKYYNVPSNRIDYALEKVEIKWIDKFQLSSPQEQTEVLLGYVHEFISDNILLHYLIVYLLFMLLFFIGAKIILDRNIEFKWLQKYPRIQGWWMKYLSLYKVSNTAWMVFIVFVLIFFNIVSILSFWKVIEILEFIKK